MMPDRHGRFPLAETMLREFAIPVAELAAPSGGECLDAARHHHGIPSAYSWPGVDGPGTGPTAEMVEAALDEAVREMMG